MKRNIFVLFVMTVLYTSNAYAYLDAGTSGMAIQFLLGAIAATGVFAKVYWQKIKSFAKTHWHKIKLYFKHKRLSKDK